VTYVNAELVLRSLATAIEAHFEREGHPVNVVLPQMADEQGVNAQSGGPLFEMQIRRHERDPSRDQTEVPLAYIYEDRDTGDQTVENYDPGSPLPPPTEKIRIGAILLHYYEMEIDIRISLPIAALGTKRDGSRYTYPAELDGDTEEIEWLSTRRYERILTDALSRIDPTEGNRQGDLVDPREADDPDKIDGDWPPILDIRQRSGDDRDEPASGDGTTGLRVWEQRVEFEYYRLVDTVARDGPDEPITELDLPGLDDWIAVDPDVWKGTIGNLSPNIEPDDIEDDAAG
jgi:hypothetical protein